MIVIIIGNKEEEYKMVDKFKMVVDDILEMAKYDPELADGLRWIEDNICNNEIDIYDGIFNVILSAKKQGDMQGFMKSLCRKTKEEGV